MFELRGACKRSRKGFALHVVLGLIVVLLAYLFSLQAGSSREAALGKAHSSDSQHLYRAEAVSARISNRLKKRPWEFRYYAEGPPGTGPWSDHEIGKYRDADFQLWIQDVEVPGGLAVPGLADLFVRMRFQDTVRSFHYRLTVLPASRRRPRGVIVEWFGRAGEEMRGLPGRRTAAQRATRIMHEREVSREIAEARLERLPREARRSLVGGRSPEDGWGQGSEALVEHLEGGDDATANRRRQIRNQLHRGVLLLGEDARGFQMLLPPLLRHRTRYRAADHSGARAHLREALQQAGRDLDLLMQTGAALSHSHFADAWKRGPASEQGVEDLERADSVLSRILDAWRRAPPEERERVDSTTLVNVQLDRSRVNTVSGNRSRADDALAEAERIAGEDGVYDGADPEAVIAGSRIGDGTDWTRVRSTSDRPLPPSGFPPVSEGEVDDFLDSASGAPGGGWEPWPRDNGVPEDEWRDGWEQDRDRITAGETSDGDGVPDEQADASPTGDIDRDGDGVPDSDSDPGGPDPDGDGIPGAEAIPPEDVECLVGCMDLPPAGRQTCQDDCLGGVLAPTDEDDDDEEGATNTGGIPPDAVLDDRLSRVYTRCADVTGWTDGVRCCASNYRLRQPQCQSALRERFGSPIPGR